MALGDIFDEGFDLYKKNLSFFILVSALVIVPGLVILQVANSTFSSGSTTAAPPLNDISQFPLWLGWNLSSRSPLVTSSIVAYMLSFGGLVVATSSRYINQPVSVGGVFMLLLRRVLKLLVTFALISVMVAAGFALCFIPAILPIVFFVLSAHCIMLENPRFLKGLSRSYALVNGQAWRTLGFLIMLYSLYWVLNRALISVMTYVFTLIINSMPGVGNTFGNITGIGGVSWQDGNVQAAMASIASLLVTPFIVCVLTVYYYDLRVRNEAYDVLALARELNYPALSELGPYLPAALPPGAVSYSKPVKVKKTKVKP